MKIKTQYDVSMTAMCVGAIVCFICLLQVNGWLAAAFLFWLVMIFGDSESDALLAKHGRDVCLGTTPEPEKQP